MDSSVSRDGQNRSSRCPGRSRSNTIFRMFVEVMVDMRETSSATDNDEENTSSRSSERFPRVGMENTGEPRYCVGQCS